MNVSLRWGLLVALGLMLALGMGAVRGRPDVLGALWARRWRGWKREGASSRCWSACSRGRMERCMPCRRSGIIDPGVGFCYNGINLTR
jgi:hypothetical protein